VERLERLVNLVVALLDTTRPLTRDDLRERVGGYSEDEDSFRRNFERDKELLRHMGIPVVAEPVDPAVPALSTGYRIPRNLYELPDPGLDDDELMALGLAASTVAFEGAAQGATTTALWKLAAIGRSQPTGRREGTRPTGEVDGAGPGGDGARSPAPGPPGGPVVDVAADPTVAALFAGVAERRVVRFGYSAGTRRVDPYRLSYRQGRWYLSGFDHVREAERTFRADRMTGPVDLEEPAGAFERPAGAPIGPPPPWRLGDDEEIVVELRVDAEHSDWVRSLAGEQAVAGTSSAGDTFFKLGVTNREAFRSFVLGLLEHAEVVGPPEIRDEIICWLASLAGSAP